MDHSNKTFFNSCHLTRNKPGKATLLAGLLVLIIGGSQTAQALKEATVELTIEDLLEAPELGDEAPPPIDPDDFTAEPVAILPNDNIGVFFNGFDYAWQRKILGAEIPHRMGSIGAVTEPDFNRPSTLYDNNSVGYRGFGAMTFSVGKDGDFASPELLHTAVYSPDIKVKRGVVTVAFEDDSNDLPLNPTVSSLINRRISIPLDEAMLDGTLDHYALLLNGFEVSICQPGVPYCDCSISTTHDDTSSCLRSMWPYHFRLGIDQCAVGTPLERALLPSLSVKSLNCEVTVEIERSWSPGEVCMHFPYWCDAYVPANYFWDYTDSDLIGWIFGKEFIDQLGFVVDLYYTVAGGDAAYFNATEIAPIVRSSETELGSVVTDYRAQLAGFGRYSSAIVGLRGFGFTLSPPADLAHLDLPRGRYIRSYTFKANKLAYDSRLGQLDMRLTTGVFTPGTVFNSQVQYEILPTVLQFNDAYTGSGSVYGEVCQISSCDPENNQDVVLTGMQLNYGGF